MKWQLAKSLEVLRQQINERFPKRSKKSDGTIGDRAHASRKSDHNPNRLGDVQALDITHDPANGVDAGAIADKLRLSRDPRIKYLISNGRIASSYAVGARRAWEWGPYSGKNPHRQHFHISVVDAPSLYNSTKPWTF